MWIQGALLSEGMVHERGIWWNRRGIWGHKFYAVRTPKSVRVRKIIYLNFRENWRDEFTITLNGRARRMFLMSELDLGTWAGKPVRVRGWVKS